MNTRNQIILVVVIIAVAAAVAVPIAYYQISERVEQQFSFNPTISEEEKETGNFTYSSDPEVNKFIKEQIINSSTDN
jgi:cytoskeletal protein RodZ